MGCDGGTIPKRHELVKGPRKVEKVDKNAELVARWYYCALSQEKLCRPIVACELGRLYNKDAIIEFLLDKSADKTPMEAASHIKSIKNVTELNLADNPAWSGDKESIKGDKYDDIQSARFICPVVGLEMNGRHRSGHLQLDQVAQSPTQPGLEHFQGWGIHSFSGQPVPVPHHLIVKSFFLISNLNLLSFSLKPLPLALSLHALVKSPSPAFLPLQVLEGCYKVSLEPSLLQAEQPQLSQPVFIGEVLQPSDHLHGPPLDSLQQVHVLLMLGSPELDAVLQDFIPWYSTKQIPEEAKVCFPEDQGSELAVHPPRCRKDLELHHFMVTAAKAALELHILHQPLLGGEDKVQHSTSPHWLLCLLEKEVIINTFPEPPRLPVSSCVVPPTDIRVAKVPHKDQGLSTFCFLRNCGCVFSERALKEIKSEVCHKCGVPFQEEDVIILNGNKEDVEVLKKRMEDRRLKSKLEKILQVHQRLRMERIVAIPVLGKRGRLSSPKVQIMEIHLYQEKNH
ncbi:LOW QUALITY PROTEIN: hypothetical protein QYF61_024244 [Mycteria americana]|uniref:Replication termination factor 2 n=4 Tax=Aequornithes TaxID=3073812 RepID=A0AAN7NL29_MYCAM|nr:LOW QUALITY PROTEIN: hypothetical protein QYF61_024244 [Mycteria americana]